VRTKKDELTKYELEFLLLILEGHPQVEAYKLSSYKSDKMSDEIIARKASEIFNKERVQKRYNELREKVIVKAEEKSIATVTKMLEEYMSIVNDDISNYVRWRTEKTIIGRDEETGDPITDYALIFDFKDSETIDTKNIQEISRGKDGQFKFKLYSRKDAMDKVAQHLMMFKEKVEVDLDTEIKVVLEGDAAEWSK
jgi:phage terminase small subunit